VTRNPQDNVTDSVISICFVHQVAKLVNINFNIFDFDLIWPKVIKTNKTYRHNAEACWHNHCCRGVAVTIAYSEYVFVALLINRVTHVRFYIAMCGLFGPTICLHEASGRFLQFC